MVSGWTDSAVQIIDISHPTSPTATASVFDSRGNFDALYRASDIEVATISGKPYALVASWADDAIQVIDITNPSSPCSGDQHSSMVRTALRRSTGPTTWRYS